MLRVEVLAVSISEEFSLACSVEDAFLCKAQGEKERPKERDRER